jgi:hypothetical protein
VDSTVFAPQPKQHFVVLIRWHCIPKCQNYNTKNYIILFPTETNWYWKYFWLTTFRKNYWIEKQPMK